MYKGKGVGKNSVPPKSKPSGNGAVPGNRGKSRKSCGKGRQDAGGSQGQQLFLAQITEDEDENNELITGE